MHFALQLMKVHPTGKSCQLSGPQLHANSALEFFGALMEFQERWARPDHVIDLEHVVNAQEGPARSRRYLATIGAGAAAAQVELVAIEAFAVASGLTHDG